MSELGGIKGPVIDVPSLDLVLFADEGDKIGVIQTIEHIAGEVDFLVDIFSKDEFRDVFLVLE